MLPRVFLAVAPLLLGACGTGQASNAPPVRPASRTQVPADAAAPPPALPSPVSPEVQVGLASWYGPRHHGSPTASGARFDMRALTAAHPTLPMGTRVRVTLAATGRSVVVTVNDRGPHVGRRIVDLSWRAARHLGLLQAGVATVSLGVEPLSVAPGSRRPGPPLRPAAAGALAVAAVPQTADAGPPP